MMFFMNYFLLNFILMVFLIILMLISLAFLTLFERKILGYIQDRKGPNKVGIMGIFQPFSDVIKLLNKEFFNIDKMNLFMYYISVILILVLSLLLWFSYPFYFNLFSMNFSFMYLLSIMCLGVYPIMLGGWSSNSNYSMLGSIRSVSQSVSYEVSLFLIMFLILMLIESYSMVELYKFQFYMKFFLIILPIYFLFLISMLIELNRTPFDLVEGESELVSGFNTEYFSGSFALIFMAEYLNIIFMSLLITLMFMMVKLMSLLFMIIWFFHIMFIVWIRGVLPRIRYDELMYFCWKKILTIVLIYMIMIFGMKMLFIYLS